MTAERRRRVLVLDTSAFIAGFDLFSIEDEQFTVPLARDEVSSGSMPSLRLRAAVESGKLKVKAPDERFVQHVRNASKSLGDACCLSDTDLQVLALAFQLKEAGFQSILVSDDYAVQNVANRLGMQFAPLITFGIKYELQWLVYCPACHRKYPHDYLHKTCRVCGTRLKRKPAARKLVKKS